MSNEFHAESKGLDISLTMFASFFDVELGFADDDADEALVAQQVAPFRVRVGQVVVLGPSSQATIFSLCNVKQTSLCTRTRLCADTFMYMYTVGVHKRLLWGKLTQWTKIVLKK